VVVYSVVEILWWCIVSGASVVVYSVVVYIVVVYSVVVYSVVL